MTRSQQRRVMYTNHRLPVQLWRAHNSAGWCTRTTVSKYSYDALTTAQGDMHEPQYSYDALTTAQGDMHEPPSPSTAMTSTQQRRVICTNHRLPVQLWRAHNSAGWYARTIADLIWSRQENECGDNIYDTDCDDDCNIIIMSMTLKTLYNHCSRNGTAK
jgi:hypothetical protein